MKLDPIVVSLLDTDLYKFNMDQVIFHTHTDLTGEYYFRCRDEGVVFTREMFDEINAQIDHLCTLHFNRDELDYLRSIRYIKGDYVYLRSGAGTNYSYLGMYNNGTPLTITGTSGDWTSVTIGSKSGWIFSQYVAKGTISVSTSGSATGKQIAELALKYVGYKYVWGGKSPSTGFDCSGLVYYVYSQFGYTLPRVANDQASYGKAVSADDLQPGDILCFYSGSNYVGHVGIYIGDGKFVHASTSTTGVIISELSGYYYTRGFTARRVV